MLPAPHVGFHLFFFCSFHSFSLPLFPTVLNEMERSRMVRIFVHLNVDEKYRISLSKTIPPFFFFSINACIYTQDQRKENLKKVKKLFHLDGINIFFPFDELTNVITLSLSFFLSRLKSNISYVFLKEKGNIIHSSCLEKFIIASFKTVRDNEYY